MLQNVYLCLSRSKETLSPVNITFRIIRTWLKNICNDMRWNKAVEFFQVFTANNNNNNVNDNNNNNNNYLQQTPGQCHL